MAGGLLNLIAIGNQNIITNGNPNKSFFKVSYSKYTNFGLQKYRIDQVGQTNISLNQDSKYTFKISRYGDLLMDTYLVLTLPTIWSPVLKYNIPNTGNYEYRPYEFKWIKNIGTQIIKDVTITIGGHIIQKFSGSYIQNIIERDYNESKKKIFNNMTGNIDELNNPEKYANRKNNYPNAFKKFDATQIDSIEPSIHSKQLFIPINTWFSILSTSALPLVSLQYTELEFIFTLRPLVELFTIKDVIYDLSSNTENINTNYYDFIPRIKASQSTNDVYGFHRFIQEPPVSDISYSDTNGDIYYYSNTRTKINPDIHLITTQCFLDDDERKHFAEKKQSYLIKEVHEYDFPEVNKGHKIKIESNGLVSNWMWYFQRDDIVNRNEWSNYTNWNYEDEIPNSLEKIYDLQQNDILYSQLKLYNDLSSNIFITGDLPSDSEQNNQKLIMKNFAIICDGKYREQDMPSGVFDKIEKFSHYNGNSKDGLYHYSFAVNNDPYRYQPSGAFNTNKFKVIEFEYNNYFNPPLDLSSVFFTTICDPVTGIPIATTKEPTSIYKYNYNLHIYEERYNILEFQSGTADLVYSR